MAIPNGYNVVPNFRYLEQIAGATGSAGNVYYVDSGTGADTEDGLSWETALATLDAAIGKCTANNGDIIFVAPGHTETWTTTGAKVVGDIAGVTVIGLGQGSDRPTFSFGHTGTTWAISAANVTLVNLLLVSAVDSITTFGTISGADCTLLDIETRDTTDIEAIDTWIVTGDRLIVKNYFHNGYTGGNANARVFKMNGVDNALFENCRFMTKVTTGVINFVTTACTNIVVKNCDFLVTSTTDLSKNIVATIGSNTWEANNCFDLGAGCSFSGGSGAAVQKDDVGAVTALIGTPAGASVSADIAAVKAAVDAVDDYVDTEIAAITTKLAKPTGDAAADATISDVIGIKADTVGGTSIVALAKQAIAAIGVVDGLLDVPTEDLATDATINQVVGKKSDTVAGTSLVALSKQAIAALLVNYNILNGVTTNTAAVKREAGRTQVFTKAITSAANAGAVTLATITGQACTIKSISLTADGVTTADLTSAAITGGAAGAIEFISAATAVTASINAADEQVGFTGAKVIPATGTIAVDLQGTGATAVALKCIIEYYANVDGGYLA